MTKPAPAPTSKSKPRAKAQAAAASAPAWPLYHPDRPPGRAKAALPPPPPWRQAGAQRERHTADTFRPDPALVDAVNTALFLRRPLLLTGKPGTGKSSVVHAVAQQLQLGPVLTWAIHSRATLQDGLYQYDALARLQHMQQQRERLAQAPAGAVRSRVHAQPDEAAEIGLFLQLGPLGTALAAADAPRALLIDEIDKSDIDLPNDLLNVLETGRFTIPELKRMATRHPQVTVPTSEPDGTVTVHGGEVRFSAYPFIVLTSNGERDFPAPFLRRCVQCTVAEPDETALAAIVAAHFGGQVSDKARALIGQFLASRTGTLLATDQLLNAVHLLDQPGAGFSEADEQRLLATLFRGLGG